MNRFLKQLLLLGLLCAIPFSQAVADKLTVSPDATSVMADLFILDSSSTVGAGLTGLVFNSASLSCYYHRSNSSSATAITLVTATAGTFTSSGFIAIDGTNMPGMYQLGIPNAAFAAGAKYVTVQCKGASNMAPVNAEFQIKYADLDEAIPASPTADSTLDRVKRLSEADGTAQAGAAGTITLATTAAATDDYYNSNTTVLVNGGTGAGQARCITDYVGATRVATVATNWVTNPSTDSTYILVATPNCDAAGGGGSSDWSSGEKEQIRDALGVDGTKTAATGGQLQALDTVADSILDDTGTSGVQIANDGITSAKIAADAIGASEIAADAIASSELATTATDEIATSAWAAGTRTLTGTQTFNNTGTWTGNLSGSVGSVTGAVGSVTASVTVGTNSDKTGYTLGSNGLPDTAITAASANKIADHVLRRQSLNVEASSDGDSVTLQSLYGAVAKQTNNISVGSGVLTIKKQDGVTTLGTQDVSTTSGAEPITGISTN